MSIKTELQNMGYRGKELAYVYGGAILGAATPIIGARYVFFSNNTDNLVGELLAWGGALVINACPTSINPYTPIPLQTFYAGAAIGTLVAEHSKKKRLETRKTLENITTNASK